MVKQHYLQQFSEQFNAQFGKPTIPELRQQALAQFSEQDLPHSKQELWKYTNLKPLFEQSFMPADAQAALLAKPLTVSVLPGSYRIVFVDGYYCAALSNLRSATDGLVIRELNHALAQADAWPAQHWLQENMSSFTALNAAFAEQGLVIEVADNVQIDKPIEILFIAQHRAQWVMHPRIFIKLGKHAHLQLVESFQATQATSYFTNIQNTYLLDDGAQLNVWRLQAESEQAFHLARTDVQQAAHSTFMVKQLNLGGQIARHDLHCKLIGENAHCAVDGLLLGQERQHIADYLQIEHVSAHTSSGINYFGILDDSSRGVFNGKIIVHEQAQKIQAGMINKNLLLSNNAEIDTKPDLEIFADDVQCSHGATVGQLDEQALFHLRARGVPEQQARHLLVYAFANQFMQQIMHEQLSSLWQSHLAEWLGSNSETLFL